MASTVWKGHVTFGLVSIPVKLTCAARSESVSFNQLRASDLEPVGSKSYVKSDGTDIASADIVKGYKTGKGWVVVTPDEIKALAPVSAHVAEISEVVPESEVDPLNYETAYWLGPDEGGEKPYALLYDGLRKSRYVAIAKLAMGSREHVIALRASVHGIAVHTLYYPHESRAADEYRTDTSVITEQESGLAGKLIEALAGHFDAAKFKDQYRERVLALIASKEAGTEAPKPVATPPKSPAFDIMAALEASLKLAKKAA